MEQFSTIFVGLVQNASLLLAAALLFDVFATRWRGDLHIPQKVAIGILLGIIAMVVMLTPWTVMPGLIFDTRSVLISITGLFFGTIPAVITMGLTTALRLHQGGPGVWMGVPVILASGIIGIAWRHCRKRDLAKMSWPELYLFGLTVHLAMVGLMFALPRELVWQVLSSLALPVLLIYPVGTALLGSLMVRRLIRENAEKMLLESEERNRLLADVTMEGIVIHKDGIIVDANASMADLLQLPPEELLRKRILDFVHPDDHTAVRAGLAQDYSQPNAVRIIRGDGSMFHAEVEARDFLSKGEKLRVSALRDITERMQAEQEIIAAKDAAEAANRAKSEFLANMSHELRTPLSGIMGMMQLLKTSPLQDDQQRWIAMAIQSSDRLTRLLTDLLDISRIEAGNLEIREELFSVKDLADSVSELFTVTAQEKGVALKCLIDPATPPELIGDDARLRQVLFNLVGNALKFTDQGHVILEMAPLAAQRSGNCRMLFSVSDTGIGIPEDKLRILFKPFVQVDGSYTRKYQGAGLGLAIVRRLVELMGGSIFIESTPSEGTAIYFTLPFRLPQAVFEAATTSSSLHQDRTGLRILLAEDDLSNQLPTQLLLTKAGHEVNLAENGQQVLDLLAKKDFDCILMDVQMPVMNGVEATKRIRRLEKENAGIPACWDTGIEKSEGKTGIPGRAEQSEAVPGSDTQAFQHSSIPESQHRRIPIIALTAYAMAGDREKFLEAGMDDYLAKPVKIEDLEKVLERGISRGSQKKRIVH